LDIDDQLSLGQASAQAFVLALQPGILVRVNLLGSPTALLRGQGLELSFRSLLAPLGQLRRVQPFAAQEGADLPTLCTAVGFF
jgi:hypothetical protein